jgi:ABC-type uncharacterized transport system ATPase subunit
MMLANVEYFEFDGKPEAWSLSDFQLGKINLFVGKNSTGKTRINNIISGLADFVSGSSPAKFDSANYSFKYSEGNNTYQYILNISGKEVICEKFIECENVLLDRNSEGICNLYFKQEKKISRFKFLIKSRLPYFQEGIQFNTRSWKKYSSGPMD